MQFKYPEILYALLLLLIPIIIHLFQLRKFKKVAFTNVQFLKKIKTQTRKSSQLKKWLILLTRLLLLSCIILAFAQPYFSEKDSFSNENETVIYLDNSFSMQAKGDNGSLLNKAVQDILERVDPNEPISIFTNNSSFKNTTVKAIANDLIKLDHTSNQLSYNAAVLKGQQMFSDDKGSLKNLILISDFQQKPEGFNLTNDSLSRLKLVKLQPTQDKNIAIDSVFISNTTVENLELTVQLESFGEVEENVSVSLYNGENLIAKSATDINGISNVIFTIPANSDFRGRLSIEDTSLEYDNQLFFNIGKNEVINVLTINQSEDGFLSKLYSENEFNYTSVAFEQLNYNTIPNQNLIILNELENIPNSLINSLKSFTDEGGSCIVIPSENAEVSNYNQLFSNYGLGNFNSFISEEKKVTDINFAHPLFKNVFDKRIKNFQYPKVNSYYSNSSNSSASILNYENGESFLSGQNSVYRFSSALNTENSNFKNSPLIVPVLYNIGKQSLKAGNLYYTIASENIIDIPVTLSQDDILELEYQGEKVIPLQRTFANKVQLTTSEYPKKAGILNVNNSDKVVKSLSFNYDRSESKLKYYNLEALENISVSDSVAAVIDDIKSDSEVNELWKWFIIFALVFLIIELLILKFLK